jgi:transcriptional regulator with XRE-family HTH domain
MVEVRLHTNRRPPVRVIIDPADSLELAEFVGGLHDLEHGRVVCHPLPGGTGERWLAFDILAALGKDLTSFGAEHVGMRGWWWAELWMRAEEIGDVFVLRAHLLNQRALARLLELQLACGFQLWLNAARPPLCAQQELLNKSAACDVAVSAFVARWRPSAEVSNQTGDEVDSLPAVPLTSFLTFRAACRRLLAPDEFWRADALFCSTLDAALAWLRERQPRLQKVRQLDLELADPQSFVLNDRYRPILEQQANECQQGLWRQFTRELADMLEFELDARSDSEATIRLRAIQVACFRYGLLLQTGGSWRAPSDRPVARRGLDAALRRLRTLATPRLAAAATLAVVTGGGAGGLMQLRINQLDCSLRGNDHSTLAMPPAARSLVRAYVLERWAEGASNDAPLFIEPDDQPACDEALPRAGRAPRGDSHPRRGFAGGVCVRLAARAWHSGPSADRASGGRRRVKVSIHGALVRERRIAAGWSVPELARRLGVQASVGWAMESARLEDLRQLPFGVLVDLAQVLDLDLAELFAAAGIRPCEPQPDAVVMEAILLRYRCGLTRVALVHGLGWPHERVDRALEQLAETIPTSGGRLARLSGNRYRLEARRSALRVDEWRGIAQAATSAHGADGLLSIETATLLHRLLYRGRPVDSDTCGRDEQGVVELLTMELIEDVGGRFSAVADVVYSQRLLQKPE